jgi:hypothetical protein
MSTIFLSYRKMDEALAEEIKDELKKLGHETLLDRDKMAGGGNWRVQQISSLKESDGLVALFTQNTMQKPDYIASEVGMARAFRETLKDMFIIPVRFGNVGIPSFIDDILVEEAVGPSDAAEKIHKSIQEFYNRKAGKKKTSFPKLFISHRHKDEPVASGLVSLLETAFEIRTEDIRCTSVQPYTLPIGSRTSERLRQELCQAEVVLGLISPNTVESQYVLVELGAAWGQDRPTFPLLTSGATAVNVPSPLNERHCISLEDEDNCLQLIEELEQLTSLKRRNYGGDRLLLRQIKDLTEIAKKAGS